MRIKIGRYREEEISEVKGKTLPNMFLTDNKGFWKYVTTSAILHPLVILLVWLIYTIAVLIGLIPPMAHRPEWKVKDIEFVITQKEAQPINKKTPYRSDKNSQAGGIHDPNKKVSSPSPSPAPKAKTPAPVHKTPVKQVQTAPAPVKQTPTKTQSAPPKGVNKPLQQNAPVQRPVLKPSPSTPKPQTPKLVAAPTSPFKVTVPNTGAPVGKGFSTSNGTTSTGGGAQGTAAGTGKLASGMPAPQFSTTRPSGGSTKGTSGATGHGGYGTGNMGNPGPGNPNGAPGIDAIKSPQWGPYMRELESKIKRNWHPPKGDQSKRVVLLFKIGRRGELLSVRVAKPSGSQANDQAAIQAVQLSAPFRALPPEYTSPSVEIEFTFDYNVLGATYR